MRFTNEQLIAAFAYFDELRECGVTNMWGAAPYLRDLIVNGICNDTLEHRPECWDGVQLSHIEARDILVMWMGSFSKAPLAERVECALKNL